MLRRQQQQQQHCAAADAVHLAEVTASCGLQLTPAGVCWCHCPPLSQSTHALAHRSGEVQESNPWQHLRDEDIAAAAQGFVGEVQQVPCMWSGSKYKNKPLRWYAERGEVVAREAKSIHIASFETWRGQPQAAPGSSSSSVQGRAGSDTVSFRVVASKGASVRVLVHDLGKALGCGAHVTSVRREAMGGFNVSTAWSLEVLLPLARKYAKGFRQAQQY